MNNPISAKLESQLNEPLLVIRYAASLKIYSSVLINHFESDAMPDWALQLPRVMPFLFPFRLRLSYFKSTSYGTARYISVSSDNIYSGINKNDFFQGILAIAHTEEEPSPDMSLLKASHLPRQKVSVHITSRCILSFLDPSL
jgi:hypothetical protein